MSLYPYLRCLTACKEEDWSDDEEVDGGGGGGGGGLGANEVSYLSEMLGGPVPPEMLAALGGGSLESLVSYQGNDEDLMKDPSVQIDMRVSGTKFQIPSPD